MRILPAAVTLVSVLALASQAAAVPATSSFTARIESDSGPITGSVSLTFKLYDAASGGTLVWEESQAVAASDGMVFVTLGAVDPVNNGLDSSVFGGASMFLELTVNGEVQMPRVPMVSVPYAVHAGNADTVGGLGASDLQRRVTGTCAVGSSIRAIAGDGTVTCQTDNDSGGDITAVTPGNGLSGGGASGSVSLSVDTSYVQRRVSGTCSPGSSIRAIASDGTVTCQTDNDSGGDITAVNAGTGISGGGTNGAVSMSIDSSYTQRRVTGVCNGGYSIRAILEDGTVACEADDVGGDILSVNTGAGISGGGSSGDVTVSIDPTYTQRRVSGTCSSGSSIRAIAEDGTVTCQADSTNPSAYMAPVTHTYNPSWVNVDTPQTTKETVVSATINAPVAGTVLAVASGDAVCASCSQGAIATVYHELSGPGGPAGVAAFDVVEGTYYQPNVTSSFVVPAGSTTIQWIAGVRDNTESVSFRRSRISLVFIPN